LGWLDIQVWEEISSPADWPYLPPLSLWRNPTAPPSSPQYLVIPSLNIYAPIESVGLDTQGVMKTPTTASQVAWYEQGFLPGQKGNALLTGHVDWTNGPAVFYHLRDLKEGDVIEVIDTQHQQWQFSVTQVISYPTTELPLQALAAPANTAHVNLVTCDGIFNARNQTYSNRVVVYTTLREPHRSLSDKI
jgi:LPXTG-site transpeptidase (sortase) family protein